MKYQECSASETLHKTGEFLRYGKDQMVDLKA